jgi:AcrR family transcriptional regulator
VDLLGTDGSRGLTHPRVDRRAGLPPGTTSYYFRSRRALLHAVAARLNELDLADLSMMDEIDEHAELGYSGTLGLARLVMLSGTEPYLTRTRARFELILHAHQDPELDVTMQAYGIKFYALAHDVIARWFDEPTVSDAQIAECATKVLTLISGVMVTFVNGYPVVTDAAHLDAWIQQILRGYARS